MGLECGSILQAWLKSSIAKEYRQWEKYEWVANVNTGCTVSYFVRKHSGNWKNKKKKIKGSRSKSRGRRKIWNDVSAMHYILYDRDEALRSVFYNKVLWN